MARSPKGDEAIQIKNMLCLDCFASLAVTNFYRRVPRMQRSASLSRR
jgi:hypothetical protein